MSKHIDTESLIKWLKSEKYGYLLEDKITWVNYGDLNDKFPYDEKNKTWELSRNRFIDKLIRVLNYEDIDTLVSDLD